MAVGVGCDREEAGDEGTGVNVDCDMAGDKVVDEVVCVDVDWDMAGDRVDSVGVDCEVVGENGAEEVERGEPRHSDGGGTQVLGMSAIGTIHVAVRIIPYPTIK